MTNDIKDVNLQEQVQDRPVRAAKKKFRAEPSSNFFLFIFFEPEPSRAHVIRAYFEPSRAQYNFSIRNIISITAMIHKMYG